MFGGAEIQAKAYLDYLKKNNYNVEFVNNYIKFVNYDCIIFVGMDEHTAKLIKLSKNINIKTFLAPVFYFENNKKYFYKFYRKLFRKHYGILNYYQSAIDSADVLLPNSVAESDLIKFLFGSYLTKKIYVVHNGVDDCDPASLSENLARFGIEKSKYFICCAMVDKRKNTHVLISEYLNSELRLNNIKLVLIGDKRDINYFNNQVLPLIKNNEDNIIIIPYISERETIMSLLFHSLGHIMLSDIETPGLSNLEASYLGVPLLVGDCLPVREYFSDKAFYYTNQNSFPEFINYCLENKNSSVINSNYLWSKNILVLINAIEKNIP